MTPIDIQTTNLLILNDRPKLRFELDLNTELNELVCSIPDITCCDRRLVNIELNLLPSRGIYMRWCGVHVKIEDKSAYLK